MVLNDKRINSTGLCMLKCSKTILFVCLLPESKDSFRLILLEVKFQQESTPISFMPNYDLSQNLVAPIISVIKAMSILSIEM